MVVDYNQYHCEIFSPGYVGATVPSCDPQPIPIAYFPILLLVENVTIILSELLAFLGVVCQVWGLWKEKRSLRLRAEKDFVTLLLQQGKFTLIKIPGDGDSKLNLYALSGILRFCFVLFGTLTQVIFNYITGTYVSPLQNTYEISYALVNAYLLPLRLSTILICEFTLDLRRRNATTRSLPTRSALRLPDLDLSSQHNPVRPIQSILDRLQESIIADMGERSDPMGIDGPGQGGSDSEIA
ncbi:hypothetical protein Clacol_004627 [Clathrus columnatus]|uniref:Uncharacterized protein n=1 Tax=Clathrus columnatus TaxID=1419009 RepID=A0AAV5AD32_9AGAM|nr:hypothetical protein Clacol_004627 [Clathrus columnatus]